MCLSSAPVQLAALKPPAGKATGRCLQAAVLWPRSCQPLAALFSGWSSMGTQEEDLL